MSVIAPYNDEPAHRRRCVPRERAHFVNKAVLVLVHVRRIHKTINDAPMPGVAGV